MSAPCHIGCDRVVVEFALAIRPKTKDRARSSKGRHYTPAATVVFEAAIATAARLAMKGKAPETGDVELWCMFERTDARRGDWDNYGKAVSDALNGVAYKDDEQVTIAHVVKVRRAPADRVSVAVLAVTA